METQNNTAALTNNHQPIDRSDLWFAIGIGLVALFAYARTTAPDILYGDSAEFQALSYMLGITHTTGYPVYVVLGKILGTLLPIGSFAYRINLLSALYGAGTVSGVYLLGRFFTRSRIAPALGSLILAVSYSFWTQAVVAEVYTLATLAISWSIFCLWRWQENPSQRGRWVLAALLLLGLGVHTVVELIVPAVGFFILWTLWAQRTPSRVWVRSIGMAVLGGAIGAAIFFGAFFLNDTLVNPPTSFLNVSLIPSRSLWGATTADVDSFPERVFRTVVSLQWGNALFSGDLGFMGKELDKYGKALIGRDFNPVLMGLAAFGLLIGLWRRFRLTGFMLLAGLTLVFYIVNYKVESKYVFFLATYILIVVLIASGAGFIFENLRGLAGKFLTRRLQLGLCGLVAVLAFAGVLAPVAGSRGYALLQGKATFFTDDEYTFPFKNLAEPRFTAEEYLRSVPDDALLLMEWRTLYATAYLANAEQNKPYISYREASPYPSKNLIPDSLLDEVRAAVNAGRPVYIDRMLDNVRDNFRTRPVAGSRLIQLLPK